MTYLNLHGIIIALHSDSPAINKYWRYLLGSWLTEHNDAPVDIHLSLQLVSELPSPPTPTPYFTDDHALPDGIGVLSVYHLEGESVQLHYANVAVVDVPLYTQPPTTPPVINGVILEKTLSYGRFEDVIFTSLAPLLRRHGFYLVHAFAASQNGHAALIVGPSGSGKTTTGLSLIEQGWHLLANDLILLKNQAGTIHAYATPGGISIRSHTLELLPYLRTLVEQATPLNGKYQVTGDAMVNGRWSPPTPVHTIFFPQITHQTTTTLSPQNRAIALVHLMQESMDRWDQTTLSDHVTLLQSLTAQAHIYHAHLGNDMNQLAKALTNATINFVQ